MRIELHEKIGIFDITSNDITYSRVDNMYKSGDGIGLQINGGDVDEVIRLCDDVYKSIVLLDEYLQSVNGKKKPPTIAPG